MHRGDDVGVMVQCKDFIYCSYMIFSNVDINANSIVQPLSLCSVAKSILRDMLIQWGVGGRGGGVNNGN